MRPKNQNINFSYEEETEEIKELKALLEVERRKTTIEEKKLELKKQIIEEKTKRLKTNPLYKSYKKIMKFIFNFD